MVQNRDTPPPLRPRTAPVLSLILALGPCRARQWSETADSTTHPAQPCSLQTFLINHCGLLTPLWNGL